MIVAHRNSLRGLVKHIDGISTGDIQKMAFPNGIPLVYKFERTDGTLVPIKHRKAVAPLSGIWLEKSGLLKKALDYEETLAKNVDEFPAVSTFLSNGKYWAGSSFGEPDYQHYFSSNHSNIRRNVIEPTGVFDPTVNSSEAIDEDYVRWSDAIESWSKDQFLSEASVVSKKTIENKPSVLNNHCNQEQNEMAKSVKYTNVTLDTQIPFVDPILTSSSPFIRSLAKLQSHRALLSQIDSNDLEYPNISDSGLPPYDTSLHALKTTAAMMSLTNPTSSTDNNGHQQELYQSYANLYIDPKVLNSAAYESVPEDFLSSYKELIEENGVRSRSDVVISELSNEEVIKRLNQISFFADKVVNSCIVVPRSKPTRSAINELRNGKELLLVIIRHGKTEHNQLGLFTGWEDAMLAEEGRQEALKAGKLLRKHGIEVRQFSFSRKLCRPLI
jgi:hypothetical protein